MKDLSNWDLINELKSRGFTTELLFYSDDVDRYVNVVNEGLDEGEEKLVLDDYEKQEILDSLCYDYYIERINEDIFDKVWNYKNK